MQESLTRGIKGENETHLEGLEEVFDGICDKEIFGGTCNCKGCGDNTAFMMSFTWATTKS